MTLDNKSRVGRSKAAAIHMHSDNGFGGDAHPAINVKVYRLPEIEAPDQVRETAYELTREEFWDHATDIAHEHGYSCVFSEGRSGGWLVPFYQTIRHKDGQPRDKFHHWPGQGGEHGYPRYPDVENDPAERRRFRKFQADILAYLRDVPEMYAARVKDLVEAPERERQEEEERARQCAKIMRL